MALFSFFLSVVFVAVIDPLADDTAFLPAKFGFSDSY